MGTPTAESAVTADLGVTPSPDFKLRLVVIDGSDNRRQLMTHVVEQTGDVVVVGHADGPVSAVEAVGRLEANVVLLEVQLPLTQGPDTISALRDDFPALTIIVCSFHATAATKRAALDRGADEYLAKPVSLRDLSAALRSARRRSESLQYDAGGVEMASRCEASEQQRQSAAPSPPVISGSAASGWSSSPVTSG